MSRYEMETIGEKPRGLRLRSLMAGALTVVVTGGFLAVLLVQAAQIPAVQPQLAAERLTDETAMDWRPQPPTQVAVAD